MPEMTPTDTLRAAATVLREVLNASSLAQTLEGYADALAPPPPEEDPVTAALRAVAEATTPEELAAAQVAAAAFFAGS